jgi:hypothetical protein
MNGQGDWKMRALTVEELGFVSGGFGGPNVDGGGGTNQPWSGHLTTPYLVQPRTLACPPGVDCYTVYANRQQRGWFREDSFAESQCQAAFQGIGSLLGGALGGMGGGAAAAVEVTIGVVASPETGGVSLALTVTGLTTAQTQIFTGAAIGGLLGNQAGTTMGFFAC